VNFEVGGNTDTGRHRTINEDTILLDDAHHLYAVADGMGGHQAGEVASATAIEALRAVFRGPDSLADAVRHANEAVIDKATGDAEMHGMGTTLTAVALADSRATLGHVGDSRAYLLRDGDMTQLTEDHSFVGELVREGQLTPEEAEMHPQRSMITRALGIDRGIDVDVYQVDLRAGDRLLLCSDGLTGMVREPDIVGVLRRERSPRKAADKLIDLANDAGGDDNITVIIVDAVGDPAAEGLDASAALAGTTLPGEATGQWEAVAGEAPALEPTDDRAAPPAPAPGRARAPRKRRRRVARVLAWMVPVLVVGVLAVGFLGWYARRAYFVGIDRARVTVLRGVPGGLLGWQPTVETRSRLAASDLTPAEKDDLTPGHRFTERAGAVRFVHRLERGAAARGQGPLASTTTTSSTAPGTATRTSTP
jgi:protein phosphatase